MRIISGKYRGRIIEAPAGRDIRPTADRVRESVFNILEHGKIYARPGGGSPIMGAHVLDAFAGTGALGLEALSRGAASVTFLDTDTKACKANVDGFDAGAETQVIRADCLSLRPAKELCGLILLDPPYNKGLAAPALKSLANAGWISDGAICVIELAAKEEFDPPAGFTVTEERRYGAARVILVAYSIT